MVIRTSNVLTITRIPRIGCVACQNRSQTRLSQIGPSSTNKQIRDTMVTTTFYHFTNYWPLKVGTLHERKFSLKKYQNARSFFLSHPVNLINKSSEKLFQKVQQIYICLINMIFSRNFIIDKSRSTLPLTYCTEPPTF